MKKLLILLFVLISVSVMAQTQTTTCYQCEGRGHMGVCNMCGGSGAMMTMFGPAPCICFGTGRIVCMSCGGKGYITIVTPTPPTPTPTPTPWIDDSPSGYDSSKRSVDTTRPCHTCRETGICSGCGGHGQIKISTFNGTTWNTCPNCNGSKRCQFCGGDGVKGN